MRMIDANTLKAEFTGNFNDGYYTVAEIKAIIDTAPTVGEWISVSDRLPSEYGNYIAFCEGEVMECTYAPPKKGMIPGWSTCDAHGVHFFGEKSVTHWMPLPEPPKEEKDDA